MLRVEVVDMAVFLADGALRDPSAELSTAVGVLHDPIIAAPY